jgi:hypothetical protein
MPAPHQKLLASSAPRVRAPSPSLRPLSLLSLARPILPSLVCSYIIETQSQRQPWFACARERGGEKGTRHAP